MSRRSAEPQTDTAEKLLIVARAVLTGADSVLSEIAHRYPSVLPTDVQRDVEASYWECRTWAARIGLHLDAGDDALIRETSTNANA
jgi:hypothetical protein